MEELSNQIAKWEKVTSAENFWQDAQKGAGVMQKLETLRDEESNLLRIKNNLGELNAWREIIDEENETDIANKELEEKIKEMEGDLAELSRWTLLNGPYDQNDVILTVRSGAGGVDAQDWAEMLRRMYLKFAEKEKMKARIVDESRGQEAGIKSATLEINGAYAYGFLKGEAGVHRLVRLSPFNANHLRQTSFASVEVLPIIEDLPEIVIKPQDIRIDVFHSSGAGGQSVNTTDSAVRITHLPTGIVVTCQNERSQLQNREEAMKILKARLYQKHLEKLEEEKATLKGEHKTAGWSNQIRSYVLHPYKLVKDHRTNMESTSPDEVLAGELKPFMEAYLKESKK